MTNLPVKQDKNPSKIIAPAGRLQNNSVVINGVEYEVESLLKFLVSKIDWSKG